jgi:hypothetical protein
MNNFSFDYTQRNSTNGTTRSQHTRPSSPAQHEIYYDLCMRKNIQPLDIASMSYQEAYEEIGRIRSINPATDGQKKFIIQLCERMEMESPSDAYLGVLQYQKAKDLIDQLIEQEKVMQIELPPTMGQLEQLVSWYYCEDIPFEDFGVKRTISLDATHINYEIEYGNENAGKTYTRNISGSSFEEALVDFKKLFPSAHSTKLLKEKVPVHQTRKLSAQEFADALANSLTRQDASELIARYRSVFYTWEKTRITISQENRIRELEAKLSNTKPAKAIKYAVVDGQIVEIEVQGARDKARDWAPSGYDTPYEGTAIKMLSKEYADTFIKQLESEIANKEMYRYGERSDGTQTFELIRKAQTESRFEAQEENAMEDAIHKMFATIGYEVPEVLQAMMSPEEYKRTNKYTKQKKATLLEFMLDIVDRSLIEPANLLELVEKSELLTDILMPALEAKAREKQLIQ